MLVVVARGLSNVAIGQQLHISAATAKTQISRLLMKLDSHNRSQLVVAACESRLVTPR